MRVRSRTAAAGAALVSTAMVLTGPAAGAAPADASSASGMLRAALASFPLFAAVPESRGLDAPVMLHGKLTDTKGAPLAGAQVLLAAWPSNDVIHALPIGAWFAITPVARTVAAADGAYELRSLLTPLLTSLTTRDGLDIELDVFHNGLHYTYLNQVVPDRATGAWVNRLTTDPLAAAPSLLANSRNSLNVALDASVARQMGADWTRASLPSDQRPPAAPGCGPYEKWATSTAMTTVATAVARNGVKITTEYSREATSELTTGASRDGSLSATPAGTRSRTAGFGAIWNDKAPPKQTVAHEYRIDWQHVIARRLCAKDFRGSYYEPTYLTSPDQTTGGTAPADENSARYPAWNCNPDNVRPAGSNSVWTERQRAYTYGADWSLPITSQAGLIGSARSGYSDDVKVVFEFRNPRKAYWCGTSGYPAADGQRLQAVQGGKNDVIPGQR